MYNGNLLKINAFVFMLMKTPENLLKNAKNLVKPSQTIVWRNDNTKCVIVTA